MSAAERIARAEAIINKKQHTAPIWIGDDGWFRIGHTDDMRQMLDDLGIRTSAQ